MADLSLHDVRTKTLETTFLRKLEERTAKRELARADITQQTHEVARARHAEDAQVTRAAARRRSLDDEQRRRDAQLAVDLRNVDQDRLQQAQRAAANQTAQDLNRVAQAREGTLRAEDAQITAAAINPNAQPASARAAEQEAAHAQAIEALTRQPGQDPNRGVIVDVLA